MYGRTMNVTISGHTFRIMAMDDGEFMWRELGTFGPPTIALSMSMLVLAICNYIMRGAHHA